MSGVLAIIPARAGSKTVPDKNIRVVGGKPLLVHAIEQGLASSTIDRVIVSTDSQKYADMAKEAGADVPFLRPEKFAGDRSTDLQVFTHALTWLKENEGYEPEICVNLRPTHPVRRVEDIDAMVTLLIDRPDLDSVRSIVPTQHPPFKMWFMNDDNLLTPVIDTDIDDAHNLPRQSLPATYLQNASIDVVRSNVILEKNTMSGDTIYGYLMEDLCDIDTPQDLKLAEEMLSSPTV